MSDPQLVQPWWRKGSGCRPAPVESWACWMVVHEHHHGMKPSEYDIREIDEDLYLAVLSAARSAQ